MYGLSHVKICYIEQNSFNNLFDRNVGSFMDKVVYTQMSVRLWLLTL
jgi:hypothetical protein